MEQTANMQQEQQAQHDEVKEEIDQWKPDLNFPPTWYEGTMVACLIYLKLFFPFCFFTENAF